MPLLTAASARTLAANEPRTLLLESAVSAPCPLHRSFLFRNPVDWLEAHALEHIAPLLTAVDKARSQGLYAAGFLHYEAGYAFEPTAFSSIDLPLTHTPLAAFGIYRAPERVAPSITAAAAKGLLTFAPSRSQDDYTQSFKQVQQAISAGDTYQLNLTLEALAFHDDPLALYEHFRQAQPVPFAALINLGETHILSASPELFFHIRGRDILTRPMKGTAPRSAHPIEDRHNRATLAASEKDRAENVMIVDLLRNDLGRVATTGSVRTENLFHIDALPTVFQMTSDVRATLGDGVDILALFRSLFPSGSIVGAPKIRSMQILRQLEARDRGIYTGAIGYLSPLTDPEPEAVFSVAIRTATLHRNELRMGIGSGVVADSTAAAEYRESLLKAAFLLDRNFGLIETLRWQNNRCDLLDLHLARLHSSATELGFAFIREHILHELAAHTAALDPIAAYKLRFVLRPDGSLTFSPADPLHTITTPLGIGIADTRTNSADPWLAHKTTHRDCYDRAFHQAHSQGLADVLFFNQHGHLTEGAIHNVFLRHGTLWSTPPRTDGVLPGVFRQHFLEQHPDTLQTSLTEADLRSADEILLTNAVRGARQAHLHPTP